MYKKWTIKLKNIITDEPVDQRGMEDFDSYFGELIDLLYDVVIRESGDSSGGTGRLELYSYIGLFTERRKWKRGAM